MLVIEDRLDDDPSWQAALKGELLKAGLWDKIYFPPDSLKGPTGDWPTLNKLLGRGNLIFDAAPLVVFSSRRKTASNDAIFRFRWDFMDENGYGNDSVDFNNNKWVKPHSESKALATHLCIAMNHFPYYAPTAAKQLLIDRQLTNNMEIFIKQHVGALFTATGRYPNWINLDFVLCGGGAAAVVYCNKKLQRKTTLLEEEPTYATEVSLPQDKKLDEVLQGDTSKE